MTKQTKPKPRPPLAVSPACETRFIDQTAKRPARIKATHMNNRAMSVTVPWDGFEGIHTNHERAAAALFERIEWGAEVEKHGLLACSVEGGGWVWMVRL